MIEAWICDIEAAMIFLVIACLIYVIWVVERTQSDQKILPIEKKRIALGLGLVFALLILLLRMPTCDFFSNNTDLSDYQIAPTDD